MASLTVKHLQELKGVRQIAFVQKVYRQFAAERDRLQLERVAAYKEYISDVQSASYPAAQQDVQIQAAEFEKFLSVIENKPV